MGEKKDDEAVQVECPTCGAKVKIGIKDADEKMSARCPKGHDIPLVKAF